MKLYSFANMMRRMKHMKVLLINGSPHEQGCTYTALGEVAKELETAGIATEIVNAGREAIRGCIACGHCRQSADSHCILKDNSMVNTIIDKAKAAAGFVFGSPVHYAAASGTLTTLLDRCFYAGGKHFAYKPGAAVMSCRRGGATATFEQLNKYFTINNMPIVSSQYWNMVHGNTPDEVRQDLEGLQTMRTLGRNMAWLLKCLQLGRENGLNRPEGEAKVATNFIR